MYFRPTEPGFVGQFRTVADSRPHSWRGAGGSRPHVRDTVREVLPQFGGVKHLRHPSEVSNTSDVPEGVSEFDPAVGAHRSAMLLAAVNRRNRQDAAALSRHPPPPMRETILVTRPYDARWVLRFLGARALAGVERVVGSTWERATLLAGNPALLRVHVRPGALEIETPVPLDPPTRARLERLFDTRTNPRQIRRALERDLRLRRVIARRPGLRVPGAWDPFEVAVRAIIGQQISVAAAVTVASRLVAAFGTPWPELPGGPWRGFPTAELLASAPLEEVPGLRLRAPVVRALAAAVSSGAVRLDGTWPLDEVIAA